MRRQVVPINYIDIVFSNYQMLIKSYFDVSALEQMVLVRGCLDEADSRESGERTTRVEVMAAGAVNASDQLPHVSCKVVLGRHLSRHAHARVPDEAEQRFLGVGEALFQRSRV